MPATNTSAKSQARYNNLLYNQRRYNGGRFIETLSTDLVVFEGFSLNNGSTIITSTIVDVAPTRGVLGGNVPRADGRFHIADYWRNKTLRFEGVLTVSTATLLEALMDTVRKSLRKPEGILDITRNSVVRRYIATLIVPQSLFPKREHFHTTWIPFGATFECRTPFGTDRDFTLITEQITTSPTTMQPENTGTIEAQPIIEVIVDAADTATVLNIQRLDGDGDIIEQIEHTGTISAGDHFEFDSVAKTVKKNGSEVNFLGSFLEMDVGGNSFKFTVTATSFDMNVTIKHRNRFL